MGCLTAINSGCSVIVETDDDDWPEEPFWQDRVRRLECDDLASAGAWANAYAAFASSQVWPRGFPLVDATSVGEVGEDATRTREARWREAPCGGRKRGERWCLRWRKQPTKVVAIPRQDWCALSDDEQSPLRGIR